ncbi:hypothetical protein CBS147355_4985 [Penicillium roqueforti]|nr:hypothetical protein CBS147355_4985 [Penicillium roqueforti]
MLDVVSELTDLAGQGNDYVYRDVSFKRPYSECSQAVAAVETKRVRLQAEEEEESTMGTEERTLHPRELLRQLSESMNGRHDELSVTLPAHSTWRSAIQAVVAALDDVDESFLVMPRRCGNRRAIREIALQAGTEVNFKGLPIRTNVDLGTVSPRPPRSESVHERLREIAKDAAKMEWRDPYVSLHAGLGDSCLPLIRANITLKGIDGNEQDLTCELEEVEMVFNTGAHRTIITEELLSPAFREYLRDPIHDLYRSPDGIAVQVDSSLALSNSCTSIDAVALILPKAKMPNQLVGILFGQISCIDRLSLRAIPRHVLLARGEGVSDQLWGDILVEEYANLDGELVSI